MKSTVALISDDFTQCIGEEHTIQNDVFIPVSDLSTQSLEFKIKDKNIQKIKWSSGNKKLYNLPLSQIPFLSGCVIEADSLKWTVNLCVQHDQNDFENLKKFLTITNFDSNCQPLHNHLGLFFTKEQWTVAKTNAYIKKCICKPQTLNEFSVLKYLQQINTVEDLDSNSIM